MQHINTIFFSNPCLRSGIIVLYALDSVEAFGKHLKFHILMPTVVYIQILILNAIRSEISQQNENAKKVTVRNK